MKWISSNLILIGVVFALLAGNLTAESTTIEISPQFIQGNAVENVDFFFQTNPTGFNLTIRDTGEWVFLRPQFNLTTGTIDADTFRTNFATSRTDAVIRLDSKIKWAFNATINSATARNNLRSINFDITHSKGIDVDTDGQKIYFQGGAISFDDLIPNSWTYKIINSSLISVGNVTGKTSLFLDPEITVWHSNNDAIIDSWMWQGLPDFNYGASATLNVSGGGYKWEARTLMGLNLQGIIPRDATVTAVTLFMREQNVGAGQVNITMFANAANWTEGDASGSAPTVGLAGVSWNYTSKNSSQTEQWFNINYNNNTCGTQTQCDVLNNFQFTSTGIVPSTAYNVNFTDTNPQGNLTLFVNGMVNGTYNSTMGFRFVVMPHQNDATGETSQKVFHSSEATVTNNVPKWFITYTANLTLNISNSTSTTPSSPITIYTNFLNGNNNSQEIFGGRYLLVTNTSSGKHGVTWLYNATSGFYKLATVGTDQGTNDVAIFTINTTGVAFTQRETEAVATRPLAPKTIDVNDDGTEEFIFARETSGNGIVKYQNGTNAWATINTGCLETEVGNFDDNASDMEIAFACNTGSTDRKFNITAYNASLTRKPIWTIQTNVTVSGMNFLPSTTIKSAQVYEMKYAVMYNGEPELAIAWGNESHAAGLPLGVTVLNATSGLVKYWFNTTMTQTNGRCTSVAPIDANKVGYYNAWVVTCTTVAGNGKFAVFNKTESNRTYLWSSAESTAYDTHQVATGDLDGDGFKNEFVFLNESIVIMAYQINGSNFSNFLWGFIHPFLLANRTATAMQPFNNVRIEDIDRSGSDEVVLLSGSGTMYILNGNGTVRLVYESKMLAGSATGAPGGISSASPLIALRTNTTDNSTMIAWGDQVQSQGNPGDVYAYEWQPCKISIPTGMPLVSMGYNYSTRSWYYYNSTGLPAGNYNYTIYCDGNMSGYGAKSQNGTLSFSSGGASVISFTVYSLFDGNWTNSNTLENYTEQYYFNSSSMYKEWIKPCANPDAVTNCQNGANRPSYSILNTGNVAISIFLKLSNAMPNTGITMCANSTGEVGVSNLVDVCTQGNLNETKWNKLAVIPTATRANITVYANFSYTNGGVYSNLNTINSTE